MQTKFSYQIKRKRNKQCFPAVKKAWKTEERKRGRMKSKSGENDREWRK